MATNLPSGFSIQLLAQLLKFLVNFYFVEISKVSEKLWLFNHKRADFWLPNFGFKRSPLSLLNVTVAVILLGVRRRKCAVHLFFSPNFHAVEC